MQKLSFRVGKLCNIVTVVWRPCEAWQSLAWREERQRQHLGWQPWPNTACRRRLGTCSMCPSLSAKTTKHICCARLPTRPSRCGMQGMWKRAGVHWASCLPAGQEASSTFPPFLPNNKPQQQTPDLEGAAEPAAAEPGRAPRPPRPGGHAAAVVDPAGDGPHQRSGHLRIQGVAGSASLTVNNKLHLPPPSRCADLNQSLYRQERMGGLWRCAQTTRWSTST